MSKKQDTVISFMEAQKKNTDLRELLDLYRKLNAYGKKKVVQYAKDLTYSDKNTLPEGNKGQRPAEK